VVIWEQSHIPEKPNKINYLSANDKQYLCTKSYTKAQTRQWRLQNGQKRYKERRTNKDNPRGVLYILDERETGYNAVTIYPLKSLAFAIGFGRVFKGGRVVSRLPSFCGGKLAQIRYYLADVRK
jgi:hypothetical protein